MVSNLCEYEVWKALGLGRQACIRLYDRIKALLPPDLRGIRNAAFRNHTDPDFTKEIKA